jgi:uncharacterized membrane protein
MIFLWIIIVVIVLSLIAYISFKVDKKIQEENDERTREIVKEEFEKLTKEANK